MVEWAPFGGADGAGSGERLDKLTVIELDRDPGAFANPSVLWAEGPFISRRHDYELWRTTVCSWPTAAVFGKRPYNIPPR